MVVLHGGASRGEQAMVSPAQLSVLRMVPVARRIARDGRSRLAVHRLLNSHRGWDARTTPVMDAAWALEQVAEQHGDVPVSLVGHSLGGRAALLAGDGRQVRSVVALNPWVLPSDHVDLRGRRVLVVHGSEDRIAPDAVGRPRATAREEGRGRLRQRDRRPARDAAPRRHLRDLRRGVRHRDPARHTTAIQGGHRGARRGGVRRGVTLAIVTVPLSRLRACAWPPS